MRISDWSSDVCSSDLRGARDVRSHAFMRHCPPRMVLGRGLREPDVSRIAGKLAALECAHDRIAIGQLAARGVDQIGTALEALERLVVDHVLGLRMERYVERDDVADRSEEHTSELQSL